MGLQLQNPIPTTPGPKDGYANTREEKHIKSSSEIFQMLAALVAVLDQYPPTQITDADGNVLMALAQLIGTEPAANIVDFTLQGGATLSIYGGTVSDTTGGGVVWMPTGLTAGQFTDSGADTSSGVAYLIVSYTEGFPANITSVTLSTGLDVPASESGTLNVQLGTFSYDGSTFTVTSSPIGSQIFDAWRNWFSFPATYAAECNPL